MGTKKQKKEKAAEISFTLDEVIKYASVDTRWHVVRALKEAAIRRQDYDTAARLRDMEKSITDQRLKGIPF